MEVRAALLDMAKLGPRIELSPSLAEQLREFSRVSSTVQADMEQISRSLNPILTELASFYSAASSYGAQLHAAAETAGKFLHGLDAWRKTEAEPGSRALAKHGWFLSPSMPLPFAVKATRLACAQGTTEGQLTGLFVTYVASDGWSNAAELASTWGNPGPLRKRVHILRACIEVLRSATLQTGAFAVLPTLIAQIDGALSELALSMGLARSGQHWVDETRRCQRREAWLAARLKDPLFYDPAMDLVLHVLFQKTMPGDPNASPLTFNRHKILHGECIDYGTAENVTRALLVLDFLSGIGPLTVERASDRHLL
jgi:hypothetical protein